MLRDALIITIAPVVLTILLELIFQGRDNSLSKILSSPLNLRFDILAWILDLSGLKFLFADFLLVGLVSQLKSYGPIWSWQILDISENKLICLLAAIIFYDFLLYWNHRLKHKFRLFWLVHRFHHSASELTAFSYLRVHSLDVPIRYVTVTFPVILIFGPSIHNFLWLWSLESLSQALAHSRLNTNFGPLGFIFASPRFHRRHHSRADDRCNYGLIFSFWDRVFHTYKNDIQAFNEATGVNEFYESRGAIQAYLQDYIDLGKSLFLWSSKKR